MREEKATRTRLEANEMGGQSEGGQHLFRLLYKERGVGGGGGGRRAKNVIRRGAEPPSLSSSTEDALVGAALCLNVKPKIIFEEMHSLLILIKNKI